MDLTATKLLVALLFGLVRFFFGILPVKLYRWLLRWEGQDDSAHFINEKRHTQVTCALALCQSFGGGVLFATCLLHMMPDVSHSMDTLKQFGHITSAYPLSQLVISCGFFLVYFLEEFSHWCVTRVPQTAAECKADRSWSVKTFPSMGKVSPGSVQKLRPPASAFVIGEQPDADTADGSSVTSSALDRENAKNEQQATLDVTEELQKIEEVEVEVEKAAKNKQQCVRYLLVVLALSLHALFEGLAIGLQPSIANIWYLFIAVSIHSATILFYISLELLLAKSKIREIVIQVALLSVTSPVGVLLGLLITQNANMNTKAKSTAVVLLEGLSAGTILYITFFEVLNREKERRAYTLLRSLFILGGFTLMALLQCAEMYVD